MNHFEVLKFATDALLVLSVVYMAVRFMRSNAPAVNLREIRDLEIILKTLIKDADVAGRALGESLTRRQHSLESLLAEIDSTERRVSRSLSNSTEHVRDAQVIQAPITPVREIPREMPREIQREVSREMRMETHREILAREVPAYDPKPVVAGRNASIDMDDEPAAPRRTGVAAYAAPQAPAQPRAQRAQASRPQPKPKQRLNIFGEPVGADATESPVMERLPRQKLTESIEIETSQRDMEPVTSKSLADLDRVYQSAEKLLKAGRKPDVVSEETSLPVDEVQAISKLITKEAAEEASRRPPQGSMEVFKPKRISAEEEASVIRADVEEEPAHESKKTSDQDPRLGVLSSMRREIQVL